MQYMCVTINSRVSVFHVHRYKHNINVNIVTVSAVKLPTAGYIIMYICMYHRSSSASVDSIDDNQKGIKKEC